MATQQLNTSAIEAAKALHPRLLHLFKRWPPRQIAALGEATSAETTTEPAIARPLTMGASKHTPTKVNPFMAWRNPSTGNWHQAHYSLRRQAEMFKLAKKEGVLELMPLSPKHPEVRAKRRLEGVKVRGTGVGQQVKGHKWERTLSARLNARRQAMAEMPALIKQWKQAGHGRGWKKWPGKGPYWKS